MKTIILILFLSLNLFAQSSLLTWFDNAGYDNTETTLYLQGQTVTPTQATRIDNFVSMLKDSFAVASLSEIADVMYLFANETQTLGLRNLVKRDHDGTIGAATVTFTVDEGFLGDAIGGYINTNYTPSTDGVTYTLDNASFGVYVRNIRAASSSKAAIGSTKGDGSAYCMIQLERTAGVSRIYINSNGLSSGLVSNTSGLSIVSRTASNVTNLYKNGVGVAPDTDASTVLPDVPFTILANNTGGVIGSFDNVQVAFVFIGRGLSSDEARKLKNCVEWYMDQLGTGVLP